MGLLSCGGPLINRVMDKGGADGGNTFDDLSLAAKEDHHYSLKDRILSLCRPPPALREKGIQAEHMSPVFAAGRASVRSFFDFLALYSFQSPTAQQFFFELTRTDQRGIIQGRHTIEESRSGEGEVYDTSDDSDSDNDEADARSDVSMPHEELSIPEIWAFTTYGQDQRPRTLREMVNEMRSVLDQIPIPKSLVGARYSALVQGLMAEGMVPIGLYRPEGILGSSLPFAVINPDRSVKLTHLDQVYILIPYCRTDRGEP